MLTIYNDYRLTVSEARHGKRVIQVDQLLGEGHPHHLVVPEGRLHQRPVSHTTVTCQPEAGFLKKWNLAGLAQLSRLRHS
jgi:hypothetical protein